MEIGIRTQTITCKSIDTYEVLAACHNSQLEVRRLVDTDAVIATTIVAAVPGLSIICFTPSDNVIL